MILRADAVRGTIRITQPRKIGASRLLAFLDDHRDWIAAQVARWPVPQPFLPGAYISVGDGRVLIDWHADRPRRIEILDDRLICGGPREQLAGRVERWLRAEAQRLLAQDSAICAAKIDRPPPKVRVGDAKGRWGSCSASGVIAYSWRLVLAPVQVRQAIAAHEVAHLVHRNHGSAFHALADDLSDGTSKAASRWLAKHGAQLHWVGRGA